jgi:REP element-mobilizing transposase RayT
LFGGARAHSPVAFSGPRSQTQLSHSIQDVDVENEYNYRRRLPHMQGRGGAISVTFATKGRKILPPLCRDIVLEHCRRGDPIQYELFGTVIMPEHVHLLLRPAIVNLAAVPLYRILQSLKSTSAHSINRTLHRRGAVWQDESFDHVLRTEESFVKSLLYLLNNPVRRGLVRNWKKYRWIWVSEEAL